MQVHWFISIVLGYSNLAHNVSFPTHVLSGKIHFFIQYTSVYACIVNRTFGLCSPMKGMKADYGFERQAGPGIPHHIKIYTALLAEV